MRVDVAAFDFDSEPMVEALIELEEQGILVRVVTDEDNADLSAINRLRRHGISVVEDKRSALMHNKFVIIDGRYLWMGSMNFTTNGVYCNNNNLVRIDSARNWPPITAPKWMRCTKIGNLALAPPTIRPMN